MYFLLSSELFYWQQFSVTNAVDDGGNDDGNSLGAGACREPEPDPWTHAAGEKLSNREPQNRRESRTLSARPVGNKTLLCTSLLTYTVYSCSLHTAREAGRQTWPCTEHAIEAYSHAVQRNRACRTSAAVRLYL